MTTNPIAKRDPTQPRSGLPSSRVYALAGAALVLGLALGYFCVAIKTAPAPAAANAAALAVHPGMPPGGHPMPTMEQMKAMADVKAAPLLAALRDKPNDPKLLAQVAALYASTHQFKDAVNYYQQSLQADPKNVNTRTELASSLYYSGDVNGELRELQEALKAKPNDVNALFNLGMIRYKGKDDSAGAIAAWQQLLNTHPDLDRKQAVQQWIAEARQMPAAKN